MSNGVCGPGPSKRSRIQGNSNTNSYVVTNRDVNNGLPPRWLYCPPMGKEIHGFLPIKTPLDRAYDELIDIDRYFHPDDVISKGPEMIGKPDAKVGLWINLTKTKRYYNPADVERHGISYVWLPLTGHGQSPTEEETAKFMTAVRTFREENADDLIVVHCTHGFNRTGFLICAYMFEELGMDIGLAVREFAAARADGIYKADYLQDMAQRFDAEEELPCPGRPTWEDEKRMDQEQSESGTVPSNGTDTNKPVPLFMDGAVPTITYVTDPQLRKKLQKQCQEYCHHKRDEFPGSQPVSLEKSKDLNNLEFLTKERYMVSWKADGVRYLVLVVGDHEVYAFDRDNNTYLISDVGFMHYQENRPLAACLMDAEMILDHVKDPATGHTRTEPRLLIYDIIQYEDENVGLLPFWQRFEMIEQRIIKPRTIAFTSRVLRREKEPISVRRKSFWDVWYTFHIFNLNRHMSHEVDGLIFQPKEQPYVSGRFDRLLKWKPPEQQTIDFLLKIYRGVGDIGESKAVLMVQDKGKLQAFAQMKALKPILPFENKIVECNFVENQWRIMRERTDKSFPNAFSTAKSVWNCIQYPIHRNYLLEYIHHEIAMPPEEEEKQKKRQKTGVKA